MRGGWGLMAAVDAGIDAEAAREPERGTAVRAGAAVERKHFDVELQVPLDDAVDMETGVAPERHGEIALPDARRGDLPAGTHAQIAPTRAETDPGWDRQRARILVVPAHVGGAVLDLSADVA